MTTSHQPQMREQAATMVLRFLLSALVAVGAIAISLAAVALAGESPVEAIGALFEGSLGNKTSLAATASRMIPLSLVALGWIVAFSTRRVSIGFEGQILAGGVGAALVGLNFSGLPAPIHLTMAMAAGMVGGALWVAPPAFLWARKGVHEIISTLLMNLIAFEMVSWLVRGPLQEESGAFARTNPIHPSALWPTLVSQTRLHWDIFLMLGLVAASWLVLTKTSIGLRLRFVGTSPTAARYMGVDSVRISIWALLASGAFAGLAGSSLILATDTSTMSPNFSAGYGFEGMVVALLARNNPVSVLPAAFLFAALRQGSGLMEARVGVSSALVTLSLGLVVLIMASAGKWLNEVGSSTSNGSNS